MKQLLTAFLFTALCSCSSVKKVSSKNEARTNSTEQKSSFVIEAKKKDSTGTGTTKETAEKKSDSCYSRKTVIKEVFNDAFDFDGSTVTAKYDTAKQAGAKPVTTDRGKLLYRETTILESGNIAKAEQTEKQVEQKITVQAVDTSARGANEQGTVSNANRSQDDQKNKQVNGIGLKGFLIGIFLLAVIVFVGYKIIH